MNVKEYWQTKIYWQKGLIAGLIFGFFKLPFFFFFGELIPNIILSIFSVIPDEWLCSQFYGTTSAEACGWFAIFYGWLYNPLFYGLIGLGVSLIIKFVLGDTKK